MASRAGYVVALLMICGVQEGAWAQAVNLEQLCGKFPDFSFTQRERELSESEADGKIDVLKRFFGSGELAGKLRTERERYYQTDPRGRAPQFDAILLYKICTFLERDPSIPTREKINILLEVRAALSAPVSVPEPPAGASSSTTTAQPARPATPQAVPTPAPAAMPPVAGSQAPVPPRSERLSVDGAWTVITRPFHCRNPGRKFPVSVSNGIVNSQVARQMQGSLSTDGTIQFNYVVQDSKGYVWTNFMEGKITGESGSGSMHSLGRGTNCKGAFRMTRLH
jgi:hypothetical protein